MAVVAIMGHFVTFLFGLCVLAGTPLRAADVVTTPQTRAALILDRAEVASGEAFTAGLSLQLKKGWHTYWRTPGDSGLATEVIWTLPDGMTAGPLQWPAPRRMPTGDLMNFGYEDEVILPVALTVGNTALGPAILKAHATWLACAEICIPEEAAFDVPLQIVARPTQASGPHAAALAETRAQIPDNAPWSALFSYDAEKLVVTLGPGVDTKNLRSADFFPDGDSIIMNAAPQRMTTSGSTVIIEVMAANARQNTLAGVVVLEREDGTRTGYEVSGNVDALPPRATMTLLAALLFAFVGGLILNVMPCVLPVLTMKILAAVERGAEPDALRRDAIMYTAGVISAFTSLVAVLLLLRAGGQAIGWGFQLQNPVFIAALACLMLLLGLSMSGVFAVGGAIGGIGQSLTTRKGGWGAFFTGMLAVVVATPCTAPFMGAALGFALTQSTLVTFAVFEGLALGLAFPYLLIGFVPAIARRLPRPGLWMERVKQILAFGLYGASAWLLWVLAQQVDAPGLAVSLLALISVAFAGWSYGVSSQVAASRRIWLGLAIVAMLIAGIAVSKLSMSERTADAVSAGHQEEPFTAERLAELRAQQKPVFVNFTAAWCITCLVNERVALSRPEVRQVLQQRGIVYLKADWTTRDPAITAALHGLGRDGVPTYALYPAQGEVRLLPQILTPALVFEALGAL